MGREREKRSKGEGKERGKGYKERSGQYKFTTTPLKLTTV